jgi:hypothetical protein
MAHDKGPHKLKDPRKKAAAKTSGRNKYGGKAGRGGSTKKQSP